MSLSLRSFSDSEILSRTLALTRRERSVIAEYEPRTALPVDRVRTVVTRIPAPSSMAADAAPASTPTTEVSDEWQENHRRNSGEILSTSATQPGCHGNEGTAATFLVEARKVFQFIASEDFEKKFKRIMLLAAHRLPRDASYEQVFELAMDCFLEKHDPSARQQRYEERRQKATARKVVDEQPADSRKQRPRDDAPDRARDVPVRVRDQVSLRDGGQCTYVSPNGRRCGSTHVLQIDHVVPIARGGASTADNLRLLCAYHNRLEARRLMGVSAAGRRRESATAPVIFGR